jgi:integrase
VTPPRLPKPFYRTFDEPDEARRVGERALVALDRGEMPDWLVRAEPAGGVTVAQAILKCRNIRAVPASTEGLLDTLSSEIGAKALAELDYEWAEAWVSAMKREKHSAPGTIRKKKGALSRVLDWVTRAHPLWLSTNPLHHLPHGYSGYDENSRVALVREGIDVPEDKERNRRIDPAEEFRIVEVLRLRRASTAVIAEQGDAEGLSLMFQLALRTAMRMREIYTLTQDQVSIARKTIFLQKTKNGDRREVPISTKCAALLETPWPALDELRQGDRLFPFWDGRLDKVSLRATTSRVSALFARVFEEAGSADLHFHDSRHEALCRWVLEAPRPLTSEQLGRAAGMRDARTRQRYLSLRGLGLADMLGLTSFDPAPPVRVHHSCRTASDQR